MAKSNKDNRKIGRGRPATGTAPLVGVRMTEEFQDQIKAWAKKQDDNPPLATAIRRLVDIGLTVRTKSKQPTAARAERAKTLAWKTLESLTLEPADDDEKTSRKRRLIKGPEEFQGVRIDQPPAPSGKKPTRSG